MHIYCSGFLSVRISIYNFICKAYAWLSQLNVMQLKNSLLERQAAQQAAACKCIVDEQRGIAASEAEAARYLRKGCKSFFHGCNVI